MTTNKNEYSTSDLALATTLSTLGFVVVDMKRIDPRRSAFVFGASPELDKKIKEYWRGEIRIEPQEFFNQIKNLKSRIYES